MNADLDRDSRVLVAGVGVSGEAVVRALAGRVDRIVAVDAAPRDDVRVALEALNVTVVTDEETIDPQDFTLVVTSPGWPPAHPLLRRCAEVGIEVIGDVELAWRLDQERSAHEGTPAPRWLALTGTNGKTTTVGMLASILEHAGVRAVAAGNVGRPLVDVVMAPERYEALAIELSSFQLHWSTSLRPHAGALINIAEDHLDWHGSMEAYAQAKVSLLKAAEIAILNVDDPLAVRFASGAALTIAVTRDIPRPGEIGMVEEILVDRAFTDPSAAAELATLSDITPAAPHNITNALIASALARTIGVSESAVAAGLRAYRSDGHRIELVATVEDVAFVDDSKATNPHAAAASIAAFPSVVWVAGGLAKGASMTALIEAVAPRLRAAVLIGADREAIAAALERHAPDVPVVRVDPPETGEVRNSAAFMDLVVAHARALARPGDTVLLAPACASMDQFTSYAHRGRLFAEAVRALS